MKKGKDMSVEDEEEDDQLEEQAPVRILACLHI